MIGILLVVVVQGSRAGKISARLFRFVFDAIWLKTYFGGVISLYF